MQKGFAPIIIIIVLALVGFAGAITYITTKDRGLFKTLDQTSTTDQNGNGVVSPTISPTLSPNYLSSPISTPASSKKPTPTPTKKSTSNATATPSATLQAGTNCSYNFNVSTGSVEISLQVQTGYLRSNPSAEIKALNGCKALAGQSSDSLTNTGYITATQAGVTFGSVPPGQYNVRVNTSGGWSEYKSVTVQSSRQAVVSFTISGDATPTPVPRPTCSSITGTPSMSGTAPFYTLLCSNISGGSSITIKSIYWDFEGDGVWDINTSVIGCQGHTYNSPGTYTPKTYVVATNNQQSDVCQGTVTVN